MTHERIAGGAAVEIPPGPPPVACGFCRFTATLRLVRVSSGLGAARAFRVASSLWDEVEA